MKILRKIRSNRFVKDTTVVSFGTLLSQIISIIFYPILARIFSPSDFGLLAMISSSVTIFSISSLKYESAIILTKSKLDSINVIVLSIISAIVILSLISCCFFILNYIFEFDIRNSNYLYLIPILSLFVIIFNCYNEWCVKYRLFTNLSKNKILSATFLIMPKLLLGLFKIKLGLVIGEIMGRLATAFLGVYYLLKKELPTIKYISFGRVKYLAKIFIDFPKFIFTGQLLNTLGGQLPILFIGFFFSAKEVGYFSMALTLILMPTSLISSSIRDVFRQRVIDEIDKYGSCRHFYVKIVLILSIISFLGFSILFWLLPLVFDIFLGTQWHQSIYYSRLMIPFVLISFVSEVVNSIYILTNKQRIETIWQLLYLSSSLVTILVSLYFKTMLSFVITFSITRIVIHLININWTNNITKRYVKDRI